MTSRHPVSHPSPEWPVTRNPLPLEGDEVHVWRVQAGSDSGGPRDVAELLDARERERAASFRRPSDRARYVFAHCVLRQILGAYLDRPPGALTYRWNPAGKPALERPEGTYFNLSHSGDLVVVAVTRAGPVGVDVERITGSRDLETIARRFFAEEEWAGIEPLDAERRVVAFFRLWTRKEALLKGLGTGLSIPLSRVVFSAVDHGSAEMIRFPEESGSSREWTVRDLRPAEGYAGALAVRHRYPAVHRFDWPSAADQVRES